MGDEKNPSFVLLEPNKVTYEDRPIPELKDPHDVLVRVQWTGICGSDVHYWTHGGIGSFVLHAPMVLGHESSGIVHAIGSAVKSLRPGDCVTMEPGVPCRRCLRCREGRYNLCADMAFAATPPFDGTLARFYRLPEDFCYRLPEAESGRGGIGLDEAALLEPAAVAVHVCRQAEVKPGISLVVFGAGPVGLLCCAVARALGASRVVSVDINEERLLFARKYAATDLFRSRREESAEGNAKRMIEELGLGLGADAVIDATGAAVCIQIGIHVLRMGGTYCQAGMGSAEITFPIMAMCTKELKVKGSFRYGPGDYDLALELVASGKVNVKELISRKVSFKEAEEAFKDARDGKGIKILIAGPAD